MENYLNMQFLPQSDYYNVTGLPSAPSHSFSQFIYPPALFSQMINKITALQQSLEAVKNQLSQMKAKNGISSVTTISGQFQQYNGKSKDKICRLPKVFPKHLKCPMQGCRRCYSSRIAMRSHLRKCHQPQLQNASK